MMTSGLITLERVAVLQYGTERARPSTDRSAGRTERIADPLRQAVKTVAGLNLIYFGVEFAVALAIGSVSLFADSIDFLEDAAVNGLILIALGWSARSRALVGMAMAVDPARSRRGDGLDGLAEVHPAGAAGTAAAVAGRLGRAGDQSVLRLHCSPASAHMPAA